MERPIRSAVLALASALAISFAACGGGGSTPATGGTSHPAPPALSVVPSTNSLTVADSLEVTIAVTGRTSTPTGTVNLTSGGYASAAASLSAGAATITVPAGKLSAGSNTLTANYTPDSASAASYTPAAGSAAVAVTVAAPTVNVTPASTAIGSGQALSVAIMVTGFPGGPTPAGFVSLTSGPYSSTATLDSSGAAAMVIPGGMLPAGTDKLSASYSPDAGSSAAYASASKTANVTVTAQATPGVTVTPANPSVTADKALNVAVKVNALNGNPTPSGTVAVSSGAFQSSPATLADGTATITIPGYSFVYGSAILVAAYTPDTQSAGTYTGGSGIGKVSIGRATPMVTVTPARTGIDTSQPLSVTVAVAGPGTGAPAATGTVKLSSGSYVSTAAVLSGGSANIDIAAGVLTGPASTVTATYTPDAAGSTVFNTASGVSAAITVIPFSTVTVNQSTTLAPVTDQLMGMNLASWYDVVGNAVPINAAFAKAGIKAIRWPGGSWSDQWHWRTSATDLLPYICSGTSAGTAWGGYSSFADFITSIARGGNYDLALTADYGSNAACSAGGDPTEAAGWVAEAVSEGYAPSHVTVGNENYGNWEFDLHAKKWDAATYAAAVNGATGFYSAIKGASPTTKVGVTVDAGASGGPYSPNWDPVVLANAKYDFVEYHYYAQDPGKESDTFILHQAPLAFTTAINTLKRELVTAGAPATPIYVGEMGSVASEPGRQSWSITQGLYAGQMLGEMMNDGIARATWWIGFGNCFGADGTNNLSTSLYGWQNWGAYNVFSDGPAESGCGGAGALGTMSPTAQAFNLFQNLAVTGESALSATVAGDPTNIRAYAATHSGGTALFLFNLNEDQAQPVQIQLSGGIAASSDVEVITYDKDLYDQSHAATPVWADPKTTDMGAQKLPLTMTLTPWSMNVILIRP